MLAGVEEDRDVVGGESAAAQLLAQLGGVGGDRLLHGREVLDPIREAPGHGAALPGRGDFLQVEAGQPAQFLHQALSDHRHGLAHRSGVEVAHIRDALATQRLQLAGVRRADAPDVLGRDPRHPVTVLDRVGQVAHPTEFGHFLGDVVGELGQRLGRPNADAGRDAGPGPHRLAHVPAQGNWAGVG